MSGLDATSFPAGVLQRAISELETKTSGLDAMLQFAESQWTLNLDTGVITFIRPDGIAASGDAQVIGTYHADDRTWLWGWGHPSVPPDLRRHAEIVRQYGRQHQIAALEQRKLACTESECWKFAALATMLADAQGAYRGAADGTCVFITFGTIKLSPMSGTG